MTNPHEPIQGELVQASVPQPVPAPVPYQPAHNHQYQQPHPNQGPQPVFVVAERKSVAVALVLSFFFGPLGMLYSTVSGGLIMLGIGIAYLILAFILSVISFGVLSLPLVVCAFAFPAVCMVWAGLAADAHNQKIARTAQAASYAATGAGYPR